MRIRYPFAGAFAGLVIASAYVGLTPLTISAINDKLLHFIDFFLLTLTSYWALDLPRRFLLKAVLVGSLALGVGSELLQAALPNGRDFDPIDIAANVMGSLLALALSAWYHKRMLERKRRRKYGLVPGGDGDVELGEEGSGQELGIIPEDDDDDGGDAWDEIGGSDAAEDDAGAKDINRTGSS